MRFKLAAEWKESMGKEKNGGGGEDRRRGGEEAGKEHNLVNEKGGEPKWKQSKKNRKPGESG